MIKGINVDKLLKGVPIWLRNDSTVKEKSIVLHRNIKGIKFPHMASEKELQSVCAMVAKRMMGLEEFNAWEFDLVSSIKKLNRYILYENKVADEAIIPVGTDMNELPMALFVNEDGSQSVFVNSQDHIEVRVKSDKLGLQELLARGHSILESLGFDYAKVDPFGYVTASPALMTLGMEAQIFTHIPGIIISERNEDLENLLENNKLVASGFFGHNTHFTCNFYTFANQHIAMRSEEEIANTLVGVSKRIEALEEECREEYDIEDLKDIVARSWGTLNYANKVDLMESIVGLSHLLMGTELGLLKNVSKEKTKQALSDVFHYKILKRHKCPPDNVDFIRAKGIKKTLNGKREAN
jgi:protein arginine kinase